MNCIPKNFKNVLFINYEDKAKYFIKHFDLAYIFKNIINSVDNIIQTKSNIKIPLNIYLNKLYYFKIHSIEEICQYKPLENMNISENKEKLYFYFINFFFTEKQAKFKQILKKEYNIDFDSLNIMEDTENNQSNNFVLIDNCKKKLDGIDGLVYCNYYKNFFYNDKFINFLIEYIDKVSQLEDINNE